MSIARNHESAIVVTPSTLKHQIITRINTLVNKAGGDYYTYNDDGTPTPLVTIEDVEVYGLETKGRDVFLMAVVNSDEWNGDGDFTPYNANDFFVEQLWDVYVACEPIYSSKMVDYGSLQE
jgi:hypothetical protein